MAISWQLVKMTCDKILFMSHNCTFCHC